MPIRLSAKDFQQQFGSGLGNQNVNSAAKKPNTLCDKPAKKQKPQIRLPKKRKPNKTEAEWMQWIQICKQESHIAVEFEPWSLNLPSGTRYTPDVVLVEVADVGISITCYEVKGPHIHNERSIHAFKEAMAAFPWMTFVFAQKRESGWTVTDK